MVEFESARLQVLKNTHVLGSKTITLDECDGYVLAEKIVTKEPIPLFDSSAVDGYGVRYQDIEGASEKSPVRLSLGGMVRAGDRGNIKIKKNSAVKIFTGAPVPQSASAVVMKEVTEEMDGVVLIKKAATKDQNIRKKGEEFGKGRTIFKPGTYISPSVVAMLASLGSTRFKVYKKPRVSLIITGNEIKHPSARLKKGQIRDSNSYALSSALRSLAIENINVVHSNDTKPDTRKAFTKSLRQSDVVISVGGVSVGEYDLVKDVLSDIGVKQIFWKVAMKPGKPNYFGVKDKKLVFGLPGNPVSAMVSYYTLIRPSLLKMMGVPEPSPFTLQARLTERITKKPERMEFVRGIMERGNDGELYVNPAKGQDSHMIGGMAKANCLIYFPKGSRLLNAFSIVEVEMLQW